MHEVEKDFRPKLNLVLARGALLAGVSAVLFLTAGIILVIFAGVLLAVFLDSLSEFPTRYLKLPHKYSLTLIILIFIAAGYFVLSAAAPAISAQVDRLTSMIPEAYETLLKELQRYEWGNALIRETGRIGFAGPGQFVSQATGLLSGTAGWLVSTVIIIFIGVYTAFNPGLYQRGVVRLFPGDKRERVSEILGMMGHQLRWWLIGRLAGMVIVGVVTAFSLKMMGIPLAGLLGLISGLLTFIPNLGPIISAIPVILIALMESPSKALIVAVFYTVLQMVEGYMLTPLILQKTVSLPAALLLSAQAILGSIFGLAGIAMAAPITVSGMVLVNMLWLEKIEA